MSMHPNVLADAQQHLLAQHGKHGFIWFERDTGQLQAFAPPPDDLRAQSIVRRTTPE
jgi:hypothetical protein